MSRTLAVALMLLAWTGATFAEPADGAIISRESVSLPDNAPGPAKSTASKIVLERIIYASDGLEVEAYLARPREASDQRLPCVIFNRGGNRGFGELSPLRATFLLGRLAARGYVVAASNYRGNGEFGRTRYPGERVCSECEQPIGGVGREEFGGAEVSDVLNLIPVLEQDPQADTKRMGLFGWSRGGMMTYLALKKTQRFKAAIVGAGVADVAAGLAQRPEMATHVYGELVPGWDSPEKRAAAVAARSAVGWADALPATTPILLLHGTADWRVDPTHALDMAQALLAAKRPFRLIMLEGGDHGLREHREETNRQVDHWLDTFVRDGKPWPGS